MCVDPVTLAIISTAAAVVGTGVSVMGSIQSGKQASAQMEYQSKINNNNAILADQQAEDALARGQEEERKHRIKLGLYQGQQINAFASNGVTVDSGTPLDVLGDSAETGELEALTIRNNASREAWGYRVQAGNYRSSAGLNSSAAQNAITSGYTSGFASALTGAGTVADRWYTYNRYNSSTATQASTGSYDVGGALMR